MVPYLEHNMSYLGSQEWFLTTACMNLCKNDITFGADQHFGFLNGEISQKEFEIQINAEHRKIIRDIHSLMYDFGYVV